MIIEAIASEVTAFVEWLVGLLPSVPTEWGTTISAEIADVGALLRLVNEAVPLDTMALAVGIYLLAYGGMHAGNAVRRLVSLGTGGGGA